MLHGEARLGAGIHRPFEVAMNPPPSGLGRIHREVGAPDQLVEISAVLGGERDADAGVARKLVPEAQIGLADSFVDSPDEGLDVGLSGDLDSPDHGEFTSPPSRAMRSFSLRQPLIRDAAFL